MSTKPSGRRYSIGEVSELTGVAKHVLRQWEDRFTLLRPKRDGAGRRYFLEDDIDTVRRIHELHRLEGLNSDAVNKRLEQEKKGHGRIRSNQDIINLLDAIEADVRAALDLLDAD